MEKLVYLVWAEDGPGNGDILRGRLLQETAPRRPADGEREAGGQERGATGYFVYARGTPKAGENSHCGVIDTCIVAKSERGRGAVTSAEGESCHNGQRTD